MNSSSSTLPDPDQVRDAIREAYAELDALVAEAGPLCALSGRCCRFEEYGHTLFLSTVELAVLLADAPPPSRPIDDGQTCPWQDDRGRCTARDARPAGCRVYFCDPSYQDRGPEIAEHVIRRLKALCDRNGWPWDYGPFHRLLTRSLPAAAGPGTTADRAG